MGCVLVDDATATVVARAHNATNASCNPTLHAEVVLLQGVQDAGAPVHFPACTLYVTVEPCIMCAAALARVRVRRVVYGCPNVKFGGCGSVLHVAGEVPGLDPARALALASGWTSFAVTAGVGAPRAVALLQTFYSRPNTRDVTK